MQFNSNSFQDAYVNSLPSNKNIPLTVEADTTKKAEPKIKPNKNTKTVEKFNSKSPKQMPSGINEHQNNGRKSVKIMLDEEVPNKMEALKKQSSSKISSPQISKNGVKKKYILDVKPSAERVLSVKKEKVLQPAQFCAILGCSTKSDTKSVKIFQFPSDEEMKRLWLEMTGRPHFKPNSTSFVCSRHFDKSLYTKRTLPSTAVPSKNLPEGVLEIEYLEDVVESGNEAEYLEDEADLSTKRKCDSDIEKGAKKPKIEWVDSNLENAMTKYRELHTTQDMMAMKIMRYKKDFQKYVKLCKEADELRSVYENKCKNSDKNALLFILGDEDKKEPIEETTSVKREKDNNVIVKDEEVDDENDIGLIEMLPSRYTEEIKRFASSIYNFNPDGYIYLRHTLRTLLPDVAYLRSMSKAGIKAPTLPKVNAIKLSTESSEESLLLKISTD